MARDDRIRRALSRKPSLPPKQLPQIIGGRRNLLRPAGPPPLPPPNKDTIYVNGDVGITGYGNFVGNIIKGLKSLGLDVRINANSQVDYNISPPYFREIHVPKHPGTWEIVIMPPCNLVRRHINKQSIIYTMWECDTLEPSWVECLNAAAAVITPSQWGVDCFQRCGVTVPVYKVPLGYNPLTFYPEPHFPETCIFGTAAALVAGGARKNTQQIVGAFEKAFPDMDDVRLKVKLSPFCSITNNADSRIEIVRDFLSPPQLAEWYRSLSVFVSASFAEGFGLHLLEAMACERAIISTTYSAVSEYFDEGVGYPVDYQIVPANNEYYRGHWAQPSEESLIQQMRKVYENLQECRNKGKQAFLRARNFTWKDGGQMLYKLLEVLI